MKQSTENNAENQIVSYDTKAYNIKIAGNNVNEGSMRIDDYVDYLQNINNLCKSANELLNPGTFLAMKVNSNIEKGSIINLVQIGIHGTALFAGTQLPYPIDNLLELLGLVKQESIGLIQFLLAKKNNRIKSIIDIDDNHCRIEFEGDNAENAYIEVVKDVIKLYSDKNVRTNLDSSTKILSREGYDEIGFKKPTEKDYNYIQKDNVVHLKYDTYDEEKIVTKTYTSTVDIESVSPTKLDNKWRFKEPSFEPYWAYLNDDDFKRQVKEKGLLPPFSLKVQIKQTDRYINEKIIATHKEIIKVIEPIKQPFQTSLL